jgi:hypothetical protein
MARKEADQARKWVSSDPMPQLSTLTETVVTVNIKAVRGQDNGSLEGD